MESGKCVLMKVQQSPRPHSIKYNDLMHGRRREKKVGGTGDPGARSGDPQWLIFEFLFMCKIILTMVRFLPL